MATTTYLEDLSLVDRNALFTFLSNALAAKGWTRTIVNSDPAAPSFSGNARREEVFQSPGDTIDTGGFFIAMRVVKDSNGTRDSILLYAFTAIGAANFVGITTASRSGTTVTVNTSVAHQFSTGDVVVVNGTDNPALNECNSGNAAAHVTVTVTGPQQFTYASGASGVEAANGGTCFAVYNLTGAITDGVNDFVRLNVQDAAADFVGGVDEFALTGNVIQAGDYRFFYLGALARGHIPATMSQTLTTSAPVTGSGTQQTIGTVETPSDLFVGQTIDIIDSHTGRIFRTTLAALGPGNAIEAVVDVGQDFAAGAKIGWDPMPLAVAGSESTSLATQNVSSYDFHFAYGINGTRPWGNDDPMNIAGEAGSIEPRVTSVEESVQDTADINLGALGSYDIVVTRTSANPASLQGTRGPLRNSIGVITANQSDFDFGLTGNTLPDDAYKLFPAQPVTGVVDHIAYGPNVPGAPPL